MRHNFEEVDDISLLANLHEATLSKFRMSDTYVQVAMRKPCSNVHLIKIFIFYYVVSSFCQPQARCATRLGGLTCKLPHLSACTEHMTEGLCAVLT